VFEGVDATELAVNWKPVAESYEYDAYTFMLYDRPLIY
jgi:hypothetical protein